MADQSSIAAPRAVPATSLHGPRVLPDSSRLAARVPSIPPAQALPAPVHPVHPALVPALAHVLDLVLRGLAALADRGPVVSALLDLRLLRAKHLEPSAPVILAAEAAVSNTQRPKKAR